jgi:hypothetical protein
MIRRILPAVLLGWMVASLPQIQWARAGTFEAYCINNSDGTTSCQGWDGGNLTCVASRGSVSSCTSSAGQSFNCVQSPRGTVSCDTGDSDRNNANENDTRCTPTGNGTLSCNQSPQPSSPLIPRLSLPDGLPNLNLEIPKLNTNLEVPSLFVD